jgi:Family of unknown function (DUF6461)
MAAIPTQVPSTRADAFGTRQAPAYPPRSSLRRIFAVDGIEVTAFEPLLARDRTGSGPDRFLPQMREAALRVDEDQDESGPGAPVKRAINSV